MAAEGRENHREGGKVSSRQRERSVATLARNRHRVVTAAELLRLGYSRREIERRIESGRLVPRYRGVYAVGPGSLTDQGELAAAAVFAAPDGVISHRAAAVHSRLVEAMRPGIIDITSLRRIAAPEGIRAHRAQLPRDERMILEGIPLTTTGRTILDCAATATPHQLERMLNEAFVRGLPIRPPLGDLLDRYPGRRGVTAARTALERFEGGPTPTKSPDEVRFLDFLDRHGFPRPHTNVVIETRIGRLEVDCCWPRERLVIEVDALSTHGSRPRMLKDRRHDRALSVAGWRPGRVMDEDLDDEASLAVEIRALLGA